MIKCFRGVKACIYSPEEEPSTLISNRLHVRRRCILRCGGGILQKGVEESHRGLDNMVVGPAGPTWQLLVLHFGPVSSGVFWCIFRCSFKELLGASRLISGLLLRARCVGPCLGASSKLAIGPCTLRVAALAFDRWGPQALRCLP